MFGHAQSLAEQNTPNSSFLTDVALCPLPCFSFPGQEVSFRVLGPSRKQAGSPKLLSSCFTWEPAPCNLSLPACICGFWQHLPHQAGVLRTSKESKQSPQQVLQHTAKSQGASLVKRLWYMCVSPCACVDICSYICVLMCMHIFFIFLYIHVHMCVYKCTCICMCTCVCLSLYLSVAFTLALIAFLLL